MRSGRLWVAVVAVAILLAAPAPALAAGPHMLLVTGGIFDWLGGVFGSIGHAVLGAFTWTISLAANFILTTIGALVRLLIPHSWVHKGLQIMEWIVAVPDYAGTVSSPGGGHVYGFAGINALRDLFMWLGVAVAPLTLVYGTSRAMLGESEPVGLPTLRVLGLAVVIVSYPYWWQETAALADQVTHAILTLPEVSRGLYKLMEYAVDGVALGGWQLIDLGLMGAIGLELLGLIFLKVAVILLGALLYATGPLMIGLVATEAGGAIARAWASAVGLLFSLGVCWALLFAVGALLIGDAGTAGPLIAGSSGVGSLFGGLLLAIAGLASLWLCLKAGREAAGLLRMQLAGLLVLSRRGASTATVSSTQTRGRTTGQSLREYGGRLARAASAAGGELALAGSAGAAAASAGRTLGTVGRRGLFGTAALGARAGAARSAPHAQALLERSRAGAVAVGMARAGTASWQNGSKTRGQASGAGARARSGAPSGGRDGRGATGRAAGSSRSASALTQTNSNGPKRGAGARAGAGGVAERTANGGQAHTVRPVSSTTSGEQRTGTGSSNSGAGAGRQAPPPSGSPPPGSAPPRSRTRASAPPGRSTPAPSRPASSAPPPPRSPQAGAPSRSTGAQRPVEPPSAPAKPARGRARRWRERAPKGPRP
jgi:hypothetical protein